MNWQDKVAALEAFYNKSFGQPQPVAEVTTSGSYAKKVRALAQLGRRSSEEVDLLCQQVEHLRRSFKIMDDVIDKDVVRDGEPAFWTVHGVPATIEQAAWHIEQARQIAQELDIQETFELRLRQVIGGARLEVEMEDPAFGSFDPRQTWMKIVEKEAAFRRYLAEALGCESEIVEAAYQDGVAAQILDDSLSALHGKDGRPDNSDERLGRLTYMKAFNVSAERAVEIGKRMKEMNAPSLGRKGESQ